MKKKLIWGSVICLVLAGIFFAGELFGRYRQKRENEKICTSEKIAIVNLDKGIRQEGEIVNYAAALGALPSDQFVFTGLEDARLGIVSDKFAAYVVLPYSFSEDVCSINSDLQRSRIQYKINPRLREKLREQVQGEVQKYLQELNDNTSYMYVDAILEEFHQAQDGAGKVLTNDSADYRMIADIDEERLMVPIQYPELIYMEEMFAPADVSTGFQSVTGHIDSIEAEMQEGREEADTAFQMLEDKGKQAVGSGEDFLDYIGTVTLAPGAEGEAVYETGIRELEKYAEEYEEKNGQCREHMQTLLGEADTEGEERNPEPDAEDLGSLIFLLQKELTEQEGRLEAIRKQYPDAVPDTDQNAAMNKADGQHETEDETAKEAAMSVSSNEAEYTETKYAEPEYTETEYTETEYTETEYTETEYTETEYTETDDTETPAVKGASVSETEVLLEQIKDCEESLEKQICWLEKIKENTDSLREDVDRYNAIEGAEIEERINSGIIEPIEKKLDAEETEIRKRVDTMQEETGTYLRELEQYDPLDYIDEAAIRDQIGQMQEEAYHIQRDVDETMNKAAEYADQAWEKSEANVDSLQEQMETAYTETETNWTRTLTDTIRAKEEWHEENRMLMESLTKKLLYSRKGTVANREMYEFVISPIQIERIY